MNETQRMINQALSLRQPQKESLDILVNVLEKITLAKNMDTSEALRLIQECVHRSKTLSVLFRVFALLLPPVSAKRA